MLTRRTFRGFTVAMAVLIVVGTGPAPPAFAAGAPAAPTNLQARGLAGGRIELSWNDQSTDETAWLVYDGGTQNAFLSKLVDGRSKLPQRFTWPTDGTPFNYARPKQQSGAFKCFSVRAYNQWGSTTALPSKVCAFGGAGTGSPAQPVMAWRGSSCGLFLTDGFNWQQGSSNWDAFIIFRDGSPYVQLSRSMLKGSLHYSIPSLDIGNSVFGVSAVKGGIRSTVTMANGGRPFCV